MQYEIKQIIKIKMYSLNNFCRAKKIVFCIYKRIDYL